MRTREEIEQELNPTPLLDPLADDADRYLELLKADAASQFARRGYTRAVAAFVEAWIFATKNICFKAAEVSIEPYTDAELALLRDVAFDVRDNGQAYETVKYLQVERNFRFAYRMYGKVTGADCTLDVLGAGWQAFQSFVKIRNRITHPKRVAELSIVDAEMQNIERAAEWFMEQSKALYDRGRETYKQKREKRDTSR